MHSRMQKRAALAEDVCPLEVNEALRMPAKLERLESEANLARVPFGQGIQIVSPLDKLVQARSASSGVPVVGASKPGVTARRAWIR